MGFFALLMLLLTATVLWGLNKGFDFTDEGLYILTLTEPSQSLPYFKYGVILKGLFGWLKPGIVFYRSLRLVLTLVLGLLLGNSFIAWALGKNHKWSALHWALVCFVTVSCFSSNSIIQ